MAIKGILFNTDMVRAVLDGRKTVTRRVIKPQPPTKTNVKFIKDKGVFWSWWMDGDNHFVAKPPYQPGDYMYVRETFSYDIEEEIYLYKASSETYSHIGTQTDVRWYPSIHMSKEATRIWLKVTDVRVERLSDMTVEDALKEGISTKGIVTSDHGIIEYRAWNRMQELWDSTIEKKDLSVYGWEASPWVWVIEFERCEKPQEV